MYTLQVMNKKGEWKLIEYLFQSRAAVVDFYNKNFDDTFDAGWITKLKKY